MARPFAQVVTGNALLAGDCVWLAASERLTPHLAEALVFTEAAEAESALLRTACRSLEVVGCYLAEVRPTPQGPQPIHFREDFRRRGPSNHAHGKQAAA